MNKWIFAFMLYAMTFSGVLAQVQMAHFGDYKLKNGQILENARIGYETYGQLNQDGSNAILFPTWYGGTGQSLKPYIGRETMIDTTSFYVIVVEALGNGISSSPSNSRTKEDEGFPEFSIRDMVDLEYKLVTEVLEIDHLYAVTGISMGGMQTYQWMASYPAFFDKAIPIVGTPKLSIYDGLSYEIFKDILRNAMENGKKEATFLMLEYVLGLTPQYFENHSGTKEDFLNTIAKEALQYDVFNLYSQMCAISNHNLQDALEDHKAISLSEVFQGETLIIYSSTDHLVAPFANLSIVDGLKAQVLDLKSDCGHYAFGCDMDKIAQAVSVFLK